jgi:hypothetical protein
MSAQRLAVVVVACLALASCDHGKPFFPVEYRDTYTEVRNCRQSADHDLDMVRVLASPEALAAYRDRTGTFPEGAVLVKEEYEFGDLGCTGPIKQWTAVRRLPDGTAPEMLGWEWQKVDSGRGVSSSNDSRCFNCHTMCGREPDGYMGTCAIPP